MLIEMIVERIKERLYGPAHHEHLPVVDDDRRKYVAETLEALQEVHIIKGFIDVTKLIAAPEFAGVDFVLSLGTPEEMHIAIAVRDPVHADAHRKLYPHVPVVTVNMDEGEELITSHTLRQILGIYDSYMVGVAC